MSQTICSRCGTSYNRGFKRKESIDLKNAPPPDVCKNCRCTDCQIVLYSECDCGERHGEPSSRDPTVCDACMEIRDRVLTIRDPEILRLREEEFSAEEPLYE